MDDLQLLKVEYQFCKKCGLSETRRQVVHGCGDPHARIMFIGEGPGEDEDDKGIPFVGQSGQNLLMMLKNVELTRDEVWITNIVLCRPTSIEGENRSPTRPEINKCLSRLYREILDVDPDVIVLLGETAARTLCPHLHGKMSSKVGRLETVVVPVDSVLNATYVALVEWHPAFLLRTDPGWAPSGPAKAMTDEIRAVVRAADFLSLLRNDPAQALSDNPKLPFRGKDAALTDDLQEGL